MNEAEMNAMKAKESGRMKWDETNEMRCGPEIWMWRHEVNDRNEWNAIGFWKLPCDAINEMWCVKCRESRVGMIDRVSRMCRVVEGRITRPVRLGWGLGIGSEVYWWQAGGVVRGLNPLLTPPPLSLFDQFRNRFDGCILLYPQCRRWCRFRFGSRFGGRGGRDIGWFDLELWFSRFSDYLLRFGIGFRIDFRFWNGFDGGGSRNTLWSCRVGVYWSKELGIDIDLHSRVGRWGRYFNPNSIYHQPQPTTRPSTIKEWRRGLTEFRRGYGLTFRQYFNQLLHLY